MAALALTGAAANAAVAARPTGYDELQARVAAVRAAAQAHALEAARSATASPGVTPVEDPVAQWRNWGNWANWNNWNNWPNWGNWPNWLNR